MIGQMASDLTQLSATVREQRARISALESALAERERECERLREALNWQCAFYCDWYDNGKHGDAANVMYEVISHARAVLAAASDAAPKGGAEP